MTTPDPAALREALEMLYERNPDDLGRNTTPVRFPLDVIGAAARWALDLIEGDEHEHCDDCGRAYPDVYSLPDHLWARIHERAPGGLLCPTCALTRIADLIEGGKEVWWCETHDDPSEICDEVPEWRSKGEAPCNMVKRLLVEP